MILLSQGLGVQVLRFLLVVALNLVAHLMGHLLNEWRHHSEVEASAVLRKTKCSSHKRHGSLIGSLVSICWVQVVIVQISLIRQTEDVALTASVEVKRHDLLLQV